MVLIVGLGNPGKEYADTRHNVGFRAADFLAEEFSIRLNKAKHRALIGEGSIAGERVIIAKPQTYMNLSGESVRDICEYYKLDAHNILVMYDDIALPVGSLRIRDKGSAGGHNGMKSIIYQLRTDVFPRVRFGVGAPKAAGEEQIRHVLGRFSKEDAAEIEANIRLTGSIAETWIREGVQAAMNRYNKTSKE